MLAPRLFLSYSRRDGDAAARLAEDLRSRGFRVFLDTADFEPGENFVHRLSQELRRATAVVALISEHYPQGRWGQAELYYAVARRIPVIPVVIPPASTADLDPPLERLLRDTQFVPLSSPGADRGESTPLGALLRRARRRHRLQLAGRLLAVGLAASFLALLAWRVVANLDRLELQARRDEVLAEVTQASGVLQAPRIQGLAARLPEDRILMGELLLNVNDPAQTDIARFNSLALSGEMLQGRRKRRWYVKDLDLDGVAVAGSSIVDTSFLSGTWHDVRFRDTTFSGAFWASDQGLGISNAVFDRVKFHGSEIEAINAIDLSFVNSKFRGTTIDTTNFGKVRFATETPPQKGNPVITPEYALFEHSTLISSRTPPEPGVLDLSEPEDDVAFEDVSFVDCRFTGWFKPEWFRNSSFERCELPSSLSKEALERLGNSVQ